MQSEDVQDVDYILDHYVGGGGRWQWLIFIATFPTYWASIYPLFMHMFAAYKPDHRCFVPSCDDDTSELNAYHTDFTIPKEHLYTNIFTENAKLDPCRLVCYFLHLLTLDIRWINISVLLSLQPLQVKV